MNTYKLYQVDAFAEKLFTGNPAAVCPLDSWISDDLLQKIAMENNLAETAFYVGRGDRYEIRWFTPNTEVDLCGHATLAAAHVLFEYEDRRETPIRFYSPRSGELQVSKKPDGLTLDFPADEPHEVPVSDELLSCFDKKPVGIYKGKTDYMLVFANEADVANIEPRLESIAKLKARGSSLRQKAKRRISYPVFSLRNRESPKIPSPDRRTRPSPRTGPQSTAKPNCRRYNCPPGKVTYGAESSAKGSKSAAGPNSISKAKSTSDASRPVPGLFILPVILCG